MAQSSQEPDELLETGRYKKVQTLGKGAFGFVQLARSLENEELTAIKFLKRGEIGKYVEAEILNHSLLRHPHVIQFKEVFLTSESICISMEYATGGSLFQFVQKQGRLKEAVARWFFQQLIIGMDYCHKMGVANRDMKLENTLLQIVKGLPLPLVKICDFGYSKADFKSAAKSKVGTLTYMAPEVLVNHDGIYDGKIADIWSCGVMLYVMLCGRYPFDNPAGKKVPRAAEIVQMLDKMVNQKYLVPDNVELSPECRDLLKRMLLPHPQQRIQLDQIFRHPWFLANLPAEAATMNDTYTQTPLPPESQTKEQIQRLLDAAKDTRNSGGLAVNEDEALDKRIEAAMQEDEALHKSLEAAMQEDLTSCGGSALVAEFIHTHQH